jgi:hypothetical protein
MYQQTEYIVNRLFEIANVPFTFKDLPNVDPSYKKKYKISSFQYNVWQKEIIHWMRINHGWKRRKTIIFLKSIKSTYGVEESLAS